MANVTLLDISKGVRDSWALAGATVTGFIPVSKVYYQRQPEGAALPYCVYEFKDISAFYGGFEFFSGREYVKTTDITFKVYFPATTDVTAFVTALNAAFGWTSTDPAPTWTIPNATVISAMQSVEALEVEEERGEGQDVARYETTFSVKMQADRG